MRRGFTGAVLLAVVAAFLVVLPATAQASAFGCVGKTVRGASSCVQVIGQSTTVEFAAAGVDVGPRTTVHGRVKLTVDGRYYNQSGIITCSNSAFGNTKLCLHKLMFNQTLRNGAIVCGQFIFQDGQALSPACKTIIK